MCLVCPFGPRTIAAAILAQAGDDLRIAVKQFAQQASNLDQFSSTTQYSILWGALDTIAIALVAGSLCHILLQCCFHLGRRASSQMMEVWGSFPSVPPTSPILVWSGRMISKLVEFCLHITCSRWHVSWPAGHRAKRACDCVGPGGCSGSNLCWWLFNASQHHRNQHA